ncbi:MAG TPA: hypothetical protein VG389_01460 [Myxococcota bacterium]|jgi:hypothetical protein|nr:hypothetical protein [Myxococcota bacterium]
MSEAAGAAGGTGATELPPPNRRRGWTYFLVANAIAFVIASSIFGLVWWGGLVSRGIVAAYDFFFARPALAVSAALSPLFMTLLIGWAYGRRAAARRKSEEARAARAAAQGAH